MSDIRTISRIESVVSDHANCGRELRESHSGSTKERLIAWRTEMWEMLRALDVRGFSPQHARFLNYLRGTWGGAAPSRPAKLDNTCEGPLTQNPQRVTP